MVSKKIKNDAKEIQVTQAKFEKLLYQNAGLGVFFDEKELYAIDGNIKYVVTDCEDE